MADQNMQSLLLGKIAAYTEILVKDPNSTIFVSLGETYRKMGMFDDARQIIAKGLELHPDFGPAHIVLGRVLCQLDDFDGSVASFENALKIDSESLAALVGYARVQILLGDENSAKELLLRARELSPADPIINKLLLSLPDDCPAVSETESEVVEEVDAVESASLISTTLADLYLEQGLTAKALDIYQQLSRQNPDDLTLRRRLKDIEGLLAEETATPASKPELVEVEEVSVADQVSSEPTDSDDEGRGDESILKTLNLWLSHIQSRRSNV